MRRLLSIALLATLTIACNCKKDEGAEKAPATKEATPETEAEAKPEPMAEPASISEVPSAVQSDPRTSALVVVGVDLDANEVAEVKAVADGFWQACTAEDWDTVKQAGRIYFENKFAGAQMKRRFGKVEILESGVPRKDPTGDYPGYFVPYKVKRQDGVEMDSSISLRNDGRDGKWFIDGGL
jgi:hypothetical protein